MQPRQLRPLDSISFFCRNGIHAADACRCPQVTITPERVTLGEWWRESWKDTLTAAAILAIFVLVLVFGPMIAGK